MCFYMLLQLSETCLEHFERFFPHCMLHRARKSELADF
jgi:hypothetical protein